MKPRMHYYKAVFMKEGYPEYAFRDWSNGVTGYKSQLDERLCKRLNFSYMGYMDEEQLNDLLNIRVFKSPKNVNGW